MFPAKDYSGRTIGVYAVYKDASKTFALVNMIYLGIVVAGVVFLALILFTVLIVRGVISSTMKLVKEVDETAEVIQRSSVEVSKASEQQALGATKQATTLEQISLTLESIEANSRENSEHAGEAAQISTKVENLSTDGNEKMHEMNNTVESIKKAADETAIIVNTINDIAFQTKSPCSQCCRGGG
jgi:methyl-accepting chemotaxis protein